jgi:hypothetical protein
LNIELATQPSNVNNDARVWFEMAVNLDHAVALSADEQIIREGNQGMREIEQEVSALRDVAKDLNELTKEQGDDLQFAEDRTADADVHIDEGNNALRDIPCCQCESELCLLCVVVLE